MPFKNDHWYSRLGRTCRETFAKLPGGDARLRTQQRRIADRISELNAVSQIKHDLDSTHLDGEEAETEPRIKQEDGGHVKVEREEQGLEEEEPSKPGRMQDVIENGPADEATSPSAKRRIAAQMLVSWERPLHSRDALTLT